MEAINLKDKLKAVKGYWHPHRVARVDGMQVLIAIVQGEFVWHTHEEEDELFQVLKGTLYVDFRDRTERVREGELLVVPKGTAHRPRTEKDEEVHLLLIEKEGIAHTGSTISPLTQTQYPDL